MSHMLPLTYHYNDYICLTSTICSYVNYVDLLASLVRRYYVPVVGT